MYEGGKREGMYEGGKREGMYEGGKREVCRGYVRREGRESM